MQSQPQLWEGLTLLCKELAVSRELLTLPLRVYASHCDDYVHSLDDGNSLGVQPQPMRYHDNELPSNHP